MSKKTKIDPYPKNGQVAYAHLQPIVDYLIENGNEPANAFIWGNNRTGYFCHFQKDLDITGIEEKFELPGSIKINKEKQSIDCLNTYSLTKKIRHKIKFSG